MLPLARPKRSAGHVQATGSNGKLYAIQINCKAHKKRNDFASRERERMRGKRVKEGEREKELSVKRISIPEKLFGRI